MGKVPKYQQLTFKLSGSKRDKRLKGRGREREREREKCAKLLRVGESGWGIQGFIILVCQLFLNLKVFKIMRGGQTGLQDSRGREKPSSGGWGCLVEEVLPGKGLEAGHVKGQTQNGASSPGNNTCQGVKARISDLLVRNYHSVADVRGQPTVLVCLECSNKMPQPGYLNQQKVISHSPGGWKARIQALADSVSGEGPASRFIDGCLSLGVLTWPQGTGAL